MNPSARPTSPVGLRLRLRIDALSDERDALRDEVARLTAELDQLRAALERRRHCVYCGQPMSGRLTCAQHRDLLALDNFYEGGVR